MLLVQGRDHTKSLLENLKGRDHAEGISVDGKIILDWILGKQGGRVWTGYTWLGTGMNSRLFKDSAPWS
jgi:hypothetical protein